MKTLLDGHVGSIFARQRNCFTYISFSDSVESRNGGQIRTDARDSSMTAIVHHVIHLLKQPQKVSARGFR